MAQQTLRKKTNVEDHRHLTSKTMCFKSKKEKIEKNEVRLTKKGTRSAHTF
jgi:hypothetical protein